MPCLHAAVSPVILRSMSPHHYDTHQAPLLFIADLHLDPSRPQAIQGLGRFLAGPAREAAALFILGDLFEAWIGDDARPADEPVAPALAQLAHSGTAVYLMHGNRDFLIGEAFTQAAGATLLEEPALIDIDGERVLLEHGDLLCTDDHAYQAFRRQVRDPDWQAGFLALPVDARLEQARAARLQSGTDTATKAEAIMDVNPDTVEQHLTKWDAARLIHGHTHRPGRHALTVAGLPRERIVLGDWFEQASVLRVDQGHYTLEATPLDA